ncbi:transglycosylase SLT domain-containing protein [Acetobacteraceae bacterium ESL0709]|nr:transglycosylase SLT domain-containing protein [Acetobacteraceae bacterium ESL0697]MDF7679014.1 transglycosylase SLT domain-containing protein [Acetobacteraceae bacterium ESL0709]
MRCITATAQVERSLHLPDGFLSAMSRVETGRSNGDGTLSAWPWTINAAGVGYHYNSLHEALEAVRNFQNQGIKSIDVGCLQVNIMHHPDAFPSLETAFDPYSNALYAGQFLKQMYDQKGSWPRAAAAYHSQTPGIGEPYLWRVIEEWSVPQDGRQLITPLTARHPLFSTHNTAIHNTSTPPTGETLPRHSKYFRPFRTGTPNFTSVPPHSHFANGGPTGRTLASYRAAPVRMATMMPQTASY